MEAPKPVEGLAPKRFDLATDPNVAVAGLAPKRPPPVALEVFDPNPVLAVFELPKRPPPAIKSFRIRGIASALLTHSCFDQKSILQHQTPALQLQTHWIVVFAVVGYWLQIHLVIISD